MKYILSFDSNSRLIIIHKKSQRLSTPYYDKVSNLKKRWGGYWECLFSLKESIYYSNLFYNRLPNYSEKLYKIKTYEED